jgi:hypothetical protein
VEAINEHPINAAHPGLERQALAMASQSIHTGGIYRVIDRLCVERPMVVPAICARLHSFAHAFA